jgi:hypothetical protein
VLDEPDFARPIARMPLKAAGASVEDIEHQLGLADGSWVETLAFYNADARRL